MRLPHKVCRCKGCAFLGRSCGDSFGTAAVENAEPLSDLELDFLDRVMLLVHSLAVGAKKEASKTNISQALQSGMKNDLQKIGGISAENLFFHRC